MRSVARDRSCPFPQSADRPGTREPAVRVVTLRYAPRAQGRNNHGHASLLRTAARHAHPHGSRAHRSGTRTPDTSRAQRCATSIGHGLARFQRESGRAAARGHRRHATRRGRRRAIPFRRARRLRGSHRGERGCRATAGDLRSRLRRRHPHGALRLCIGHEADDHGIALLRHRRQTGEAAGQARDRDSAHPAVDLPRAGTCGASAEVRRRAYLPRQSQQSHRVPHSNRRHRLAGHAWRTRCS